MKRDVMFRLWIAMLFVSCALIIAGQGTAISGEAASGGPRVEAEPSKFDFGHIKAGDKPKISFTLRNTGDAELVIYDVKPSCGCTLAMISTRKLAPGEAASIVAVYNSWNASGQINKFIELRSNDTVKPLLYLDITGTVDGVQGLPGVPGS